MSQLPTVKIVREDNPRGGFAIINETDFEPDIHTMFEGEQAAATTSAEPVVIPEDWENLHWKSKVALAQDIAGDEWSVPEGQKESSVADTVIKAHLEAGSA